MATEVESLIVRLEVSQNRFEKQMAAAARAADKSAGRIEKRFATMNKSIGSQFEGMGRAIGTGLALAAGSAVFRDLADYSARFRDIQNSLKVTGLEGKALTDIFGKLAAISSAQGAPLDALATLYGRTAQAAGELKATQAEMIQFTEGVAVALRVAGSSTAEAKGALLQLSQAIGSTIVRAEEFNSVNEGARPILQAVAAGMEEAGGSVAKLRNLVLEGKISSEAFFRAFLAGSGQLQEQAGKAEQTIGQAYSKIDTAMLLLVGHLDQVTGASKNAASNLTSIAGVIAGLPAYIDAAVAGMASLQAQLNALGSSSIFTKLNDLLGVDGQAVSDEFVRKSKEQISLGGVVLRNGTVPDPERPGNRRASASVGAGASGASAPITYRAPIKPISIKDYAAPAPEKKGGGRKTKVKKETDDAYEREIKQIQERTTALQGETAAQAGVNPLINDYGYAVTVASTKQDLLNAAQEAGIKITPEVTANIQKLAEGYANASVASDKLTESQDKARESAQDVADMGKDALSGFISDMRSGVSATEALGNALDKIADKLLDGALDMLFDTTGGGTGGNIFGSIGKLFGFANGGIAARGKPLPTFAGGGVSKSASIFGEAGPEAAVPLPDGRRIPVDLKMPAKGSARGGASSTFNIDARGAQQGVGEEIRRALSDYDKQLNSTIGSKVAKGQRMNRRGF